MATYRRWQFAFEGDGMDSAIVAGPFGGTLSGEVVSWHIGQAGESVLFNVVQSLSFAPWRVISSVYCCPP